jgi:ankyrin repeat protein
MKPEETKPKQNTAEEKALFHAIRNRQAEEIRQRVADHPSLLFAYDENAFGATPLTLACFRNDREMIDLLLDLGVDVNRTSDWWAGPWSPLHCAIYNGNNDLAEHLLEHGATLDVHTAASLDRLDDLRRLLDESPDRVSEPGGDGCQPLHFAGSVKSAEILLQYGANIEARDVDHYSTPVHYLALPRPEVARYLFSQGAEADIFSAVLAEDDAVVRSLIAADPSIVEQRINQERFPPGPDHNVHNIMTFTVGNNSTPLQAAAKGNRVSMARALVECGADINGRGGYDDSTALHIAAWENNDEVAEKLLDRGADINIRSGKIHNNTPAGWAIVAGSDRVFSLLMDRGAEKLDWFKDDAEAGIAGEFRNVKAVPTENYNRILARLNK